MSPDNVTIVGGKRKFLNDLMGSGFTQMETNGPLSMPPPWALVFSHIKWDNKPEEECLAHSRASVNVSSVSSSSKCTSFKYCVSVVDLPGFALSLPT